MCFDKIYFAFNSSAEKILFLADLIVVNLNFIVG